MIENLTGRVLVVEDDPSMCAMLARHLKRSRFEVETATSAERAAEIVLREKRSFDLVISDLHLPGESGIQLTNRIHQELPLQPVLLITGDDNAALARNARATHASNYLTKPFDMCELDVAIQDVLSGSGIVGAALDSANERATAGERAVLSAMFVQVAERRSGVPRGHGDRVACIATLIALAADPGTPAWILDRLELAARSHEIGRVLTPDGSWPLAHRSSSLLRVLGFDRAIVDIVAHFEERFDGLTGERPVVPLTSRILAVADALDHSIGNHVRDGLDVREALDAAFDQIRVQGSRFDAALVKAAASVMDVILALWSTPTELCAA